MRKSRLTAGWLEVFVSYLSCHLILFAIFLGPLWRNTVSGGFFLVDSCEPVSQTPEAKHQRVGFCSLDREIIPVLVLLWPCCTLCLCVQEHLAHFSDVQLSSHSHMKFACLMQLPQNSNLGASWLPPSPNLSLAPSFSTFTSPYWVPTVGGGDRSCGPCLASPPSRLLGQWGSRADRVSL